MTTPVDVRKGFPTIAARYFGKLPGQSLMEFGTELRALTDKDVSQLREGIENGSETYA